MCAAAALEGVHFEGWAATCPISQPSSWSPSDPTPNPSLPLPLSPLAGVHVASPDLLPVLAAGQLGRLKLLLHRHEALLNAAAAVLRAVRPTRPRPHFAP